MYFFNICRGFHFKQQTFMDKRQLGKGMYIDLVSGSGISVITVMNPHKFFSNDNERFLCLPLLILSALTDFGILFAQVMFSF